MSEVVRVYDFVFVWPHWHPSYVLFSISGRWVRECGRWFFVSRELNSLLGALAFRVSGVEFFLGGWLNIFFSLILPWYLFSFYCHVPWTSRRQDSVSLVQC